MASASEWVIVSSVERPPIEANRLAAPPCNTGNYASNDGSPHELACPQGGDVDKGGLP